MSRIEKRRRWRAVLEEQTRSELSVAEFCRRKGVKQTSFYQWRKKLTASATAEQVFVPVSVASTSGVRVELPCGAIVCLPAGDERSLTQVLSLLMAGREQAGC